MACFQPCCDGAGASESLDFGSRLGCSFIAVSSCSTRFSGCESGVWSPVAARKRLVSHLSSLFFSSGKAAVASDPLLALRIVLIVLAVLLLLGLLGAYCYWKRRKGGSTVPLTAPSKPEAAPVGVLQGQIADEEGEQMSEAAKRGIPKYWGPLEFMLKRDPIYSYCVYLLILISNSI